MGTRNIAEQVYLSPLTGKLRVSLPRPPVPKDESRPTTHVAFVGPPHIAVTPPTIQSDPFVNPLHRRD